MCHNSKTIPELLCLADLIKKQFQKFHSKLNFTSVVLHYRIGEKTKIGPLIHQPKYIEIYKYHHYHQ